MHHAYLVIGTRVAGERFLELALGELGVEKSGNPDIYSFVGESFAIDDARVIADKSLEKAFGKKRIFIISAERFTNAAQNALLKTLEEPIPNTHFFILAREAKLFLPTLLSRVQIEKVEGGGGEGGEAKKFLNLTLAKRLDFSKKFEDSLPSFLDSLLIYLKSSGLPLATLEKVYTLRTFASDPSVQTRLILEHLSLVL